MSHISPGHFIKWTGGNGMERKYREVSLRKKKNRKKICLVLGLICLCQFLVVGGNMEIVLGFFLPNTLKYTQQYKAYPLHWWMELLLPSSLHYVYQKEQDFSMAMVASQIEVEESIEEVEYESSEAEWNVDSDKVINQELEMLQNTLQVQDEIELEIETPIVAEPTDTMVDVMLKQQFDLSLYEDFEKLLSTFYILDPSTSIQADLLNVQSMMAFDVSIEQNKEQAQILIYHTHSQEAFVDSVPGDASTTIVGAGAKLAELLQNQYGYQVIHHIGVYDLPSRDDAYTEALPSVETILEENPSIEVVIDLHRDASAEDVKYTSIIDGKEYAKFMLFNGLSHTKTEPIDYLPNPNLEANLATSFQLQLIAESYFPDISRGIYLKAYRYNMHVVDKMIFVELGTQTNTVEEIMNTCDILAFSIDQLLSRQ